MNIQIKSVHGILVVIPLVRRLDASVSAKFKEEVLAHIQRGERDLLLDFQRVDFIDSSCLGALVSLMKALNANGELALCSINANILGMFRLTRMDRIFNLYTDQDTALQQMNRTVS